MFAWRPPWWNELRAISAIKASVALAIILAVSTLMLTVYTTSRSNKAEEQQKAEIKEIKVVADEKTRILAIQNCQRAKIGTYLLINLDKRIARLERQAELPEDTEANKLLKARGVVDCGNAAKQKPLSEEKIKALTDASKNAPSSTAPKASGSPSKPSSGAGTGTTSPTPNTPGPTPTSPQPADPTPTSNPAQPGPAGPTGPQGPPGEPAPTPANPIPSLDPLLDPILGPILDILS